jgi:hypothetical protein
VRIKAVPKKAAVAGPSTQAMPKMGGVQIADAHPVIFQATSDQQVRVEDLVDLAQSAHLEFELAQIAQKERLLALQRRLFETELAELTCVGVLWMCQWMWRKRWQRQNQWGGARRGKAKRKSEWKGV